MDKTIGLRVRKIRELKNLSHQYVADKLSVSQSTYSDIENCKTPISPKKLSLIAEILDVPVDVIKEFNDKVFLIHVFSPDTLIQTILILLIKLINCTRKLYKPKKKEFQIC